MKLQDLMVATKTVWVEYPGCPGFKLEIAGLSRPEMKALRKRSIVTKFDRKTRQPVEELDEKKFVREFTVAVIKNWKGLKFRYLPDLLLVDISKVDPDEELPFSLEQAEVLVENSSEFDTFVNEVTFDLDNFRGESEGANVGTSGDVATQ